MFSFFRKKKSKPIVETDPNACICFPGAQVIGCPAYDSGKCVWHPSNDPYELKHRKRVDGKFIDTRKH